MLVRSMLYTTTLFVLILFVQMTKFSLKKIQVIQISYRENAFSFFKYVLFNQMAVKPQIAHN